ncbi:MAG: hypothetical protein R3A47_04950 [Polyangiales bacterium]
MLGELRGRSRYLLPWACYVVTTIAVPIANGAHLTRTFLEHCAIALVVCTTVLGITLWISRQHR